MPGTSSGHYVVTLTEAPLSDDTTHFQFSLSGIELEISGERSFVEKFYRRIMKDIEASRSWAPTDSKAAPKSEDPRPRSNATEEPVIWVHRCNEMMHKIYMSSPGEVSKATILRAVDTDFVSVVFADDELVERVLPSIERGHTLWAELTEAGRRRIAEAQPEDSLARNDSADE